MKNDRIALSRKQKVNDASSSYSEVKSKDYIFNPDDYPSGIYYFSDTKVRVPEDVSFEEIIGLYGEEALWLYGITPPEEVKKLILD